MGSFSFWHILILAIIILLLFGGNRFSAMMGDVAKGLKSFKQGLSDDDKPAEQPRQIPPQQQQPIDTTQLLVVAVIALLFIGPKELPRVMMQVGRWIGKVRGYARHFTSGIENVMREAELEEMEKKWREENERIMQLHPPDAAYPDPP